MLEFVRSLTTEQFEMLMALINENAIAVGQHKPITPAQIEQTATSLLEFKLAVRERGG